MAVKVVEGSARKLFTVFVRLQIGHTTLTNSR